MARRAGEDHRVAEERLVLDGAMARRGADDAELERAVGDALDDRLRVEDAQRDVELRMHRGELAEELREDDAARPGRGADRERAVERAGRLVRELARDLLLEREQPLGAAVEAQPRLGRLDPPARAVEELQAEPLLERAHLQADRRLGHAEPLGRLGERLALDHLAERTKLARVHNGSLYNAVRERRRCPQSAARRLPQPPAQNSHAGATKPCPTADVLPAQRTIPRPAAASHAWWQPP